ncbi:class I SAM-dependent methyltransferase [Aestuariivivens sediminis]|uniref:class I SAM-dependent methyltransferase n=1 Tax=Aestuariivivens sediminis TaxID=2913557 RepID=UPI001F5AE0BE|nr:class I SAM-dependent methyltransferase [Aestuariivivens sediminis]
MKPELQRRIQRYGWDKAAEYYENCWQEQLKPAHDLLLEVSNIQRHEHIIDIAAGTGLITFRMAEKIGPLGQILATDISDEMVKIGNQLALTGGFETVKFERMDAEHLLCDDEKFDLATCALGLMYFPDPDASLAEMFRVLKPGGRAVTAVWGSRKKCGWAEIFPIVDARVNTDVCPMFFNLGESEVLKYPFENAGFKNITLSRIETKLIYTSDEEACTASFMGGPVAMAYSRFDEVTKEEAQKEYLKSIKPFKTENGYEIPGEFVICSGIKP